MANEPQEHEEGKPFFPPLGDSGEEGPPNIPQDPTPGTPPGPINSKNEDYPPPLENPGPNKSEGPPDGSGNSSPPVTMLVKNNGDRTKQDVSESGGNNSAPNSVESKHTSSSSSAGNGNETKCPDEQNTQECITTIYIPWEDAKPKLMGLVKLDSSDSEEERSPFNKYPKNYKKLRVDMGENWPPGIPPPQLPPRPANLGQKQSATSKNGPQIILREATEVESQQATDGQLNHRVEKVEKKLTCVICLLIGILVLLILLFMLGFLFLLMK
ncbi:tio [Ateline gammaherpesvirus 3]|uniref:Protein tio n=1 Tax=Ateline herpesvirus 3 TaxID=85618 RepID=TIO_ATHV3|nr:tio [Ateline gammaherpesvirus 3]Q9YJQ8.1 RecName: Full=Protein tio [Ateline gammaherpesvirus 3]AAC95349.1 Tio protein [Ateline gammaherpesvirus 3]AAC95538.1 tio [Ateline gammaherpesvirus 3]